MDHNYIENPNKPTKCIECGYEEIKHGDNAPCDCCNKTGNLLFTLVNGKDSPMLLTRECNEREKAFNAKLELEAEINSVEGRARTDEYQSIPNQEQRLINHNNIVNPYNEMIRDARKIDEQLHLSSDLFTASTVSIESIRIAIWNDESIEADKKFFAFVSECKRRISHFQGIIFDLDKKKIEAYSEQKAWHVAMNQYANKLRADEREALKIADIHYDVKMPKPITPQKIKTFTKKATQKEIRTAVSELNKEIGIDGAFSEMVVSMLMVSKNWTLTQAIDSLRKNTKESLSEVKAE